MGKNITRNKNYKLENIYIYMYLFLVVHCDFTNIALTKVDVTLGDMPIPPIAPKHHSFSTSLFKWACVVREIYALMHILG